MFNLNCKKTGNIPIICKLLVLDMNKSKIYAYKYGCIVFYDLYYAKLKCYFDRNQVALCHNDSSGPCLCFASHK